MSEGYSLPRRLETDSESVQRDLMKLVLTIIELVRQLMERQALRRVDEGDLTDDQVEELGVGLMRLEEAMTQLREQFDLTLLSADNTSGGLDDGDTLRFVSEAEAWSETYTANTTENVATSTFQRFTAGTASQNVANTIKSLVKVINERASGRLYAFYAAGEYDQPGRVFIQRREFSPYPFHVRTRRNGKAWAPAVREEVSTSAGGLIRVGGTVFVSTSGRHGFVVGQEVELVSHSDPTDEPLFPLGTKTVTAVPSTTQFEYAEAEPDAMSTGTTTFNSVTPEARAFTALMAESSETTLMPMVMV